MKFITQKELLEFLSINTINIGYGGQKDCYLYPKTGEVLCIFHEFLDKNYRTCDSEDKNWLLRFADKNNGTFIFARDVIICENLVIGYTMRYVKAKPLTKIDPVNVDLNKFLEACNIAYINIEKLTKDNISLYDVMYNILYGSKLYVTDFDEFSYNNRFSGNQLLKHNIKMFNEELYYFLISGFLDDFVKGNNELSELYEEKLEKMTVFIPLLIKYLSEYEGKQINNIGESKALKRTLNYDYMRTID